MSHIEIIEDFYRVKTALLMEQEDYDKGNKTYFMWKLKEYNYYNRLHELYQKILKENSVNDKTYQEDYHEINY